MRLIAGSVVFLFCAAMAAQAQEPPPETTPEPPAATPVLPPRGGPLSAEPQPYEKVITKDAKSKSGIFTVHQVKDKYYYEIPKSELEQAVSLEYADRQDYRGRRIWRTAIGQPRGAVGVEREQGQFPRR